MKPLVRKLNSFVVASFLFLQPGLPSAYAAPTQDEVKDQAFTEILHQPGRPTMAQIKALVLKQQFPEWFMERQSYDSALIEQVYQNGPDVIAQFEKIFPGMDYAALGRDAAFLGDMIDAYYQSIGQDDRVHRINASGASLTGNPDDLIDFVKDQTRFDHKNQNVLPGLVIFDSTRYANSSRHTSQSKMFMDAIYGACMANPNCDAELLLEKFNFLNVGPRRPDMYKRNIYKPKFDLYQFHLQMAADVEHLQTPTEIISMDIPPDLLYSDAYHDTFQRLTRYPDGRIYALPGSPSNIELRQKILRTQVALYQVINQPEFAEKVNLSAAKYHFNFPQRRVTSREDQWQIKAHSKPPPPVKKVLLKKKIKMAAAGILMALGVVGAGTGYYHWDQQQQEIARVEQAQHDQQEYDSLSKMRAQITLAKSFGEVQNLLSPKINSPSKHYLDEIQGLWRNNLDLILKTEPSFKDVQNIKSQFSDTQLLEKLVRYQLEHLDSSSPPQDQILLALKRPSGIVWTDADFQLVSNIVTSEFMMDFLTRDKGASLEQTKDLLSLLKNSQQQVELRLSAAKFYKGSNLISVLLDNISDLNEEAHKSIHEVLRARAFEVTSSLTQENKITFSEAVTKIRGSFNTIEGQIAYIDGLLERYDTSTGTLTEALQILDPGVTNPSSKYTDAIDGVTLKHAQKLSQLVKNHDDLILYKKSIRSIKGVTNLANVMIGKAKTIDEFLDIVSPGIDNPNGKYLEELDAVFTSHFDGFAKLNPTLSQIISAKHQSHTIALSIHLMELGMKSVQSIDDINTLLSPDVENPKGKFLEEIDGVRTKNADLIASFHPNREQIRSLIRSATTIEGGIRLREAFIKNAKTIEDFNYLLQPFNDSPNSNYLAEIKNIPVKHANEFVALHPTAKEFKDAKLAVGTIEGTKALVSAYLNSSPISPEFFADIIKVDIATPSQKYILALEELYTQGVNQLDKQNLTDEQVKRLIEAAPSLKTKQLLATTKDQKSHPDKPTPPPAPDAPTQAGLLKTVHSAKACVLTLDSI